jgi:alkylated DNA repair dioxygenase AlkB
MAFCFPQMDWLEVPSVALIPGLIYIPEYISLLQAEAFVQKIDIRQWSEDLKRRVQHYGYRYDYKARSVPKEARIGILPDWLASLSQQLCADGYFKTIADQVIVNEYQPGQGIALHRDCVPCFGPAIASLSLGSACVMDFEHSKTREKTSMLLEPGSLLVLTKDARYLWRHGIAHRKTDRHNGKVISRSRRISLTFRNIVLAT